MEKYRLVLETLQYVADNAIKFHLHIQDRMFSSSDGNISSTLELQYFGCGVPSNVEYPELFKIVRKDVYNKEIGVLGTLSIQEYKGDNKMVLEIGVDYIVIGVMRFHFYKNILV